MNQFFHSYNFDQCLHSDNVEFIWDQLKRAIYSARSLCIPFLPVRSINQPKWFTPTVRHKVKYLRTLKRRLSVHSTEQIKQKIANLESELQQSMAQVESDYESQLVLNFAHSYNNEIFHYISSIRGQPNLPAQMFHNSFQASNDQEKVNYLMITSIPYSPQTMILQLLFLLHIQVPTLYMTLKLLIRRC